MRVRIETDVHVCFENICNFLAVVKDHITLCGTEQVVSLFDFVNMVQS